MKDIEYERDGIKKFAGECFKDALIAEGWSVVKVKAEAPKRSKKAIKKDD